MDAWSKDFQVSNPQIEDTIITTHQSTHMIEVDEGDLFMDEIIEDDQEELQRSSTPYSWRFDEADIATTLDLKVRYYHLTLLSVFIDYCVICYE